MIRRPRPALCLTLLLALLSARSLAAPDSIVDALELSAQGDSIVFRFETRGAAEPRVFGLSGPPRTVIDLPDSRLAARAVLPSAPDRGPVRALRSGQQSDGRLRLVLDLREGTDVQPLPVKTADDGRRIWRYRLTRPGLVSEAVATTEAASTSVPLAEASAGVISIAQNETEAEADADSAPQRFVFGAGPARDSSPPPAEDSAGNSAWDLRVHRALIESGALYDSRRPADALANLQFIASARRVLENGLEIRLGARVDGQVETGGASDLEHLELEYDETWLRYRAEDWRLTVGTQKIIWGRTDEIAPTDRLSTQDFTRLLLDRRADRRRANPALRLEWFGERWNADLVWLPVFRKAVLPQRDSLWYPVDRQPGRLLGLPDDDPLLSSLLANARFNESASGDGGGGIRLNRFGRGIDYAISVQRVRNSQPYFRLDERLRQALLSGADPMPGTASPVTGINTTPMLTFDAVYPRSWVLGADAGFAVGAWTLRAEAAWSSDMPVTRETLAFDTVSGWNWLLGAETFPGDGDLRLTVQLAGMQLDDASDILDQDSTLTLLGEVSAPFAANRWRANLRYWLGLEQKETYLNPELAWTAAEPHEFYLGLHLFDGKPRTIGGFYEARDMIVFGWRGRF